MASIRKEDQSECQAFTLIARATCAGRAMSQTDGTAIEALALAVAATTV